MSNTMHVGYAFLGLVALLAGCASKQPAPVTDSQAPTVVLEKPAAAAPAPAPAVAPAPTEARSGMYTVKRGDTLYSIALDHGQAYRDVAAWNGLEDPNKIQAGQQLRVQPPETAAAVSKPVSAPTAVEVRSLNQSATPAAATTAAATAAQANSDTLKHEPRGGKRAYSEETLAALRKADALASAAPTAPPVTEAPKEEAKVEAPPLPKPVGDEAVDWAWPLGGKLINGFVEAGSKGIDLVAKTGDPVHAAAAGKVVYAGSGLRGYGKLVIVKHNQVFLSAYAHNSQILVKEGQTVQKGQKIAEVGASDADQPMLHFEIRRQGKPVDPLKHLPGR